jgi:hypothetical protein
MDKLEVDKLIQKYRFDIIKQLINRDKDHWDTIDAIKIVARNNEKKSLTIIYNHQTDHYNLNDYCFHDESETDDVPIINKETRIEFGYTNDKFYIKGSTPIRVYSKRDSPKIPVVFSDTYEHELDEYTQSILLEEYTDNKNIPEWLVISFFNSIKRGSIDILGLIADLSFD